MCGTNNTQHNSLEDIVDGIVEIALSLKRKYHPIATFVYGLLPHDSNWSINRVYIDEINNYLYSKSKLNGINFINHTDWTFQDGSLKPNLFYANKLHLIEEGKAKLAASIYNSINPNASNINEIVSVSSKVFACDTGFNLKQEDLPMLPCNMSVRKTVCNPDKTTVKCVRKSIYNFVSTSSVLPGKPIHDCNVFSSKLVNTSSVRSSKPIHDSIIRLSKPITSSIARPSKLVSGSNVRYIKPVSVSSICPSKQTCGSNVRPSKTFSAINVHASKPVYGSNVCSRKPVSVGNVCPSKTISVSNAPSSNSGSVINVHSTKSVGTSNICSGKPVCRNNVRSSKPICRSNVCQSKPTNVNILPCKPVLTDHTYHVDSSILSQQLFFIFFLSILIFSVYYKFSIITRNIFTNLLLAIVILLSKLTCLREFFIMFISRNSTFLPFSLSTYIIYQSCRAIYYLKHQRFLFYQ